MSDYDRYASPRPGAGYARSGAAVDQGLRAYMIGVYNYMTLGLGVTGLVAYGAFAFGRCSLRGRACRAGQCFGQRSIRRRYDG